MKRIAKNTSVLCLLLAALLAGCVKQEDFGTPGGPKGNEVGVQFSFRASAGRVIASRADLTTLMDAIDDVHVLIFGEGINGENPDTARVVVRNYIQYKKEQLVYLKPGQTYYVFAAANLSSGAAYFDDVETYGDLRNKVLVVGASLIPDKLVMTTNGVIEVTPPTTLGGQGVNMTIFLSRVQSQMELNIYNKVASGTDRTVASGVFPVSFTGINIPVHTYLMARAEDYAASVPSANRAAEFTQTQTYMLPDPEATLVEKNGNWYTKQTVYGYTFENRQGRVETFTNPQGVVVPLTNVKDRKAAAPTFATIAQITSATTDKVLLTYVLPGQDRNEDGEVTNDFNIGRNCIYHLNVYINGVNEVSTDSRREYLDQLVVLTFPDMRRVDAHYMDIPVYLSGSNGRAKFQSGICEVDEQGNIKYQADKKTPLSWVPMLDSDPDAVRWLRFSYRDPYQASQASTTLYAGLTADGRTGATPILHFNEYTDHVDDESQALPPRRTAVIRVGYVSGATTNAAYETGVELGNESVFYVPVSQWGLRTVGQVGGFDKNAFGYTMLLGVESAEEFRFGYYRNQVTNNGPYWHYNTSGSLGMNQPYDGKTATQAQYDAYRNQSVFGGVPPTRDNPRGTGYDPVFNTFAADYCMRKNRDEDGNGIIEGSEIKWYLPTPVQLMQISLWRSAFQYSFNIVYTPFNTPYWSTNESGSSTALALALDFAAQQAGTFTSDVTPFGKEVRYPVRCVRDIPGKTTGMIYIATVQGNSFLAGNINGQLPSSIIGNKTNTSTWPDSRIASLAGNGTMQDALLISRYYVHTNNNPGSPIVTGTGNLDICRTYSEPGDQLVPGTQWRLPTQRELSFLYAYAGMIERQLQVKFGAGNYDAFQLGYHWTATNDGNGGHFWGVDFQSGSSRSAQKNEIKNGYYRCVKYISPALSPD